jgi:hypothetical protein
LSYKWLSLYQVQKAILDKGTYLLEEFDGTELASTYSSNRLKKFVQRDRFYILVVTNADSDDSSSIDGFTDNTDNDSLILDSPIVCRSAQI